MKNEELTTEAAAQAGNTPLGFSESPHPASGSQQTPQPASGHLLPIQCGEGKPDGRGVADAEQGKGPVRRLAPVAVVAPEKMTMGQLQRAQRDHQAGIALESEIRRLAREQGLDAGEVTRLAEAARAGFRIMDGEPIPVAGDRQTVLLAADGVNVLSVQEWVERNAKGKMQNEKLGEDEVLPRRNPFRRKTWNLTEQMRLGRRDPKLARRLKAEAWAEGEN